MAQHYVTGIDVGTYQVKVVIASETDGKDARGIPQIIGTGYAESRGLRNGYNINESDVVRSVRNAVAQAEKASGVKVKHAYISMGGNLTTCPEDSLVLHGCPGAIMRSANTIS